MRWSRPAAVPLRSSMVGAAYAAVPLYNWFCRTTGFGGTTQVSEKAPDHVLGRTITIRFDSNVAPGLPWKFVPEQNEIKVRIGEVATVNYKVVNEAGARNRRAGLVQCLAADGRRLFQQDQLLLLYRAAPEAGRNARDDGRVLCRSCNRQGSRPGRPQYDHAVLHFLPDCAIRSARSLKRPTRIRASFNGDEDDGRRPRQASRLPSGRSEPVAGGRFGVRLHHGGRRDQLDAPHVCGRAAGVRRRRARRALHLRRPGGAM